MGVSKSKANSATGAEASMPEPMPIKTAEVSIEPKAKELSPAKQVAPTAEPMTLPTKSWHALLNQQPLNADAKPFSPSPVKTNPVAPRSPPDTKLVARSQPVAKPPAANVSAVADDEPEWMQYLSKKYNAASNAPKPLPDSRPVRFKKGAGRDGGAAPAADPGNSILSRRSGGQSAIEGGNGATGGAMVIQTESYLKLLKEGNPKMKGLASNTARRTGNKTNAPPGLSKAPGLTIETATEGAGQRADPMTTSSLVKKWSSAVNTKPFLVAEATTEEVAQRTTQDDIGIEKLLFDQDPSDPAYYSDTDTTDAKKSASVHRLGRRPRVATALIRTYVMQDLCFLLDQAVGMLLMRLRRFTDQHRVFSANTASGNSSSEQAQPNQNRRFVIGIKEVVRRTKQGKVECLLVAPDIEEDGHSGGLDDRMRELLAAAYQNQTPVIFALSRARLGKTLGKSLHISVLGILDATGAQNLLKESVQLASECRHAWLQRLEK